MTEHIRRHPHTDAGPAWTRLISRMGIGIGVLAGWPVVDLSGGQAKGDEPPVLAAPAIAPKFEVSRLPSLPTKTVGQSEVQTSVVSRSWESRALPSLPAPQPPAPQPPAAPPSGQPDRGERSAAVVPFPLQGPAEPLQIADQQPAAKPVIAGRSSRPDVPGLPQPPGGVQLKISSPSDGRQPSEDVYVNTPARLAPQPKPIAGDAAVQRRLTSLPVGLHLVSRGQARSLRDMQPAVAMEPEADWYGDVPTATSRPDSGLLATAPAVELPEAAPSAPPAPAPRLGTSSSAQDVTAIGPSAPDSITPAAPTRPAISGAVGAYQQPPANASAGELGSAIAVPQWIDAPSGDSPLVAVPAPLAGDSQPAVEQFNPGQSAGRPQAFANRPVRLAPVAVGSGDVGEATDAAREPQPLRLDVVPFKFSDRVAGRGEYRPFEVPEELPPPSVSVVAAAPMLLVQRGSGSAGSAGPTMPVDWLVASRASKPNFPDNGIASGERSLMPGESVHIKLDQQIDRVEVADPRVCRAILVGRREVAVVGIRTGSTKLALWPTAAAGSATQPLIYRLEVEEERAAEQVAKMSTGVSELTSLLADMYPTARVEVVQHSNGSMTLQGSVESNSQARKILDMVRKLYLCPVYDQLTVRN